MVYENKTVVLVWKKNSKANGTPNMPASPRAYTAHNSPPPEPPCPANFSGFRVELKVHAPSLPAQHSTASLSLSLSLSLDIQTHTPQSPRPTVQHPREMLQRETHQRGRQSHRTGRSGGFGALRSHTWTSTSGPRLLDPGSSVSRCLQVSQGVSKCLEVSPSVSRCFHVSQGVSKCLKVSPSRTRAMD